MAAGGQADQERLMPCPSCRAGGSWRSNRCICSRRQLLPLVLASLCSLPTSALSFDLPLASSAHLHKPPAKGGALGHACSWMVGSLLRTSRIGMGGAVSRPMVACGQEEEGGCASDPGPASSRRTSTPKNAVPGDSDGGAWERLIPDGSSVLILGDANLSFSLVSIPNTTSDKGTPWIPHMMGEMHWEQPAETTRVEWNLLSPANHGPISASPRLLGKKNLGSHASPPRSAHKWTGLPLPPSHSLPPLHSLVPGACRARPPRCKDR